jgi:hypothetical protein
MTLRRQGPRSSPLGGLGAPTTSVGAAAAASKGCPQPSQRLPVARAEWLAAIAAKQTSPSTISDAEQAYIGK